MIKTPELEIRIVKEGNKTIARLYEDGINTFGASTKCNMAEDEYVFERGVEIALERLFDGLREKDSYDDGLSIEDVINFLATIFDPDTEEAPEPEVNYVDRPATVGDTIKVIRKFVPFDPFDVDEEYMVIATSPVTGAVYIHTSKTSLMPLIVNDKVIENTAFIMPEEYLVVETAVNPVPEIKTFTRVFSKKASIEYTKSVIREGNPDMTEEEVDKMYNDMFGDMNRWMDATEGKTKAENDLAGFITRPEEYVEVEVME